MSARSDLAGGAGWMALGLVIAAAAWRMDRFGAMGATVYTAPGLVPGLLGLALAALGAGLAWRGWRAAAHDSGAAGESLLVRRIGWMLALTLAYAAVLVGRVPFALATALFVAVFTAVYSDALPLWRRWGLAMLSGLITTAVVVLVFERIFLVRLP